MLHYCSCDAIVISIIWCPLPHQWHNWIFLSKIIKMRCNMGTLLASYDTSATKIGTIAFHIWWQLKWGITSHFRSLCLCDMMLTALSMASLHCLGQDIWNKVLHHGFCHVTPLVLPSTLDESTSITMAVLHSLGQNDQNEVQHDFF